MSDFSNFKFREKNLKEYIGLNYFFSFYCQRITLKIKKIQDSCSIPLTSVTK